MSYYIQCTNQRCRGIYREEDLSYDDGIFMMKGFCPECGEQVENMSPDDHVCDECCKALAAPDDDLCITCRDKEDEKAFDLETIDIPTPERRQRDLMDTILSIARGAKTPEEIEP